jgi:YVTN family beta-propeller protein
VSLKMGLEKRIRAYGILMVLLFIFSSFSVVFLNSDPSSSGAQSHAVTVQPLQVSGPRTEVYVKYTLGILNNTLVPGNYKVNTNFSLNNSMSKPYYVIYDPLNGDMYVSDDNFGKIYEISSITNRIIATIDLGESCKGMAYDPANGNIYVATYPNYVSVINNNKVIASVSVGIHPGYIAYDSFNGYMYVENSITDNITVFNASTY